MSSTMARTNGSIALASARVKYFLAAVVFIASRWSSGLARVTSSMVRSRLKLKRTRLSLHPHWLVQHFRFGDDRRIQGRLAPAHLERKFCVIDDAAIPAVTAQIKIRPHKDAIDGARLDAQCTKHALRIVDGKSV